MTNKTKTIEFTTEGGGFELGQCTVIHRKCAKEGGQGRKVRNLYFYAQELQI